MLNRSLSLFLSYTPCFETATSIAQQQKRLALFRDRRLLWGILTSAALPTPFDCSYAPFTYGWASDAPTFCVLLRIPRLRPPSLPSLYAETRFVRLRHLVVGGCRPRKPVWPTTCPCPTEFRRGLSFRPTTFPARRSPVRFFRRAGARASQPSISRAGFEERRRTGRR